MSSRREVAPVCAHAMIVRRVPGVGLAHRAAGSRMTGITMTGAANPRAAVISALETTNDTMDECCSGARRRAQLEKRNGARCPLPLPALRRGPDVYALSQGRSGLREL